MRVVPRRSHGTICSRYCRSVRWLIVLLLVACSSKSSDKPPPPKPVPIASDAAVVSAKPLEVVVDKRVELMSIVMRLAGAPEYQVAKTPYALEVDRVFGPFANHAAVKRTAELRKSNGIAFDAPILLAVHLDGAFELDNAAEVATIDKRWAGVDLEAYAALLRQFAGDTSFAMLPAPAADNLRAILQADNPLPFFDDMFGVGPQHTVIHGELLGTNNVGVRNGTRFYEVMSAPQLGVLVHEMAHSYINPLLAKHAAALEPAGAQLYPLFATTMRAQNYVDWQTMFNESAVRALVVLFMRENKGDVAGAAAARAEMRAGFVWINELTEVFRKYKRGTARDADALARDIATFFTALAKQYAGAPPKTPFLGPFDAVLQRPYVLALPPGPAGAYAKTMPFFADKPLVDPASRIATGTGIVAYGSPSTNPVVAGAMQLGGWKISEDGIELGGKKFAGKHLVLIATWFRGDDPTNGMAIYAAANERDLVGINSVRHGPNDWLVARRDGTRYTVIEAGDWPVDAGAWVPFK